MSKNDENARRVTRHERGKAADAVNVNFTRAGEKGIPEQGVRNIITSSLGFEPTEVDFRQILFKAKYATSDDKTIFYGIKFRPRKPKVEKPILPAGNNGGGQSVTFEGSDLEVTAKGKGINFKSLVKKVTVWLSMM